MIDTPADAFELLRLYLQEEVICSRETVTELMKGNSFDEAKTHLSRAKELTLLQEKLTDIEDRYNQLISSQEKTTTSNGAWIRRKAYRRPILEALVECGGKADKRAIHEKVYQKMRRHFGEADEQYLENQRAPRWQYEVEWARFTLRQDGLISEVKQPGVWEISEAGRNWLKTNK